MFLARVRAFLVILAIALPDNSAGRSTALPAGPRSISIPEQDYWLGLV